MSPLDNALDRVLEPVSTARGLPNAHYVDRNAFEREKQAVFFNNWAGIGFGNDVPEPGDARPIDFLGQPLLVLRDRQGEVRVYMNVCRHRGMILVMRRARSRGDPLPLSFMGYGTDGRLAATPHVGGPDAICTTTSSAMSLGLIEVRAHVWQDVIFVNMSGDAPSFEDYAADLIDRWRTLRSAALSRWSGDARLRLSLAATGNWRLRTTARAITCRGSIRG